VDTGKESDVVSATTPPPTSLFLSALLPIASISSGPAQHERSLSLALSSEEPKISVHERYF
jgi:hypothetical protein